MWFNLIGMALKTGAEVYKNKKEAQQLESVAEKNYMAKMAAGEIEYQKAVMDNQSGYKDEIVLAIVILPILVIALFFEYFNNFPDWYVWLTVGIFGSIYGLKPGLDMFKKK
jgi:hypothetical protein